MTVLRRNILIVTGLCIPAFLALYLKHKFDTGYDPQRASILEIERLGGEVGFGYGGRGLLTTAHAISVSFDDRKFLSSETKKLGSHLRNLPQLSTVTLVGRSFDDTTLEYFSGLTNLRSLHLYDTNVDGDGLSHIQYSPLHELVLSGKPVSSAGIENISHLVHIEELRVSVSSAPLKPLAALKNLHTLELSAVARPVDGILFVSALSELKAIQLRGTVFGDEDIGYVATVGKLDYLDMSRTSISDASIPRLANATQLRWLRVTDTAVTGITFTELSNLNKFQFLDIQNSAVNDNGLRGIGSVRALRRLNLNHTAISDDGLRELSSLESLEYIHIQDSDVSDESVDVLINLPRLLYLEIQGTKITAAGIERLKSNRSLEWLNHQNIR